MTQKLFCLCAALLFAVAMMSAATAEETAAAAAGCPCACAKVVAPCKVGCPNPCCGMAPPCCGMAPCRVGLFGVVRPVLPVYHPPVYRPGFYSYRWARLAAPCCPPCAW